MLLDGVPEDARSPGAAEAGPSAEELAAAQQAEAAALLEVNEGLQHRARQVLEQCNKGRPALNKAELGQLDGADARYR
jgi:predicted Zn-dependent peptidase